jgi:triacylglycerol lipase
VTFSLPAFLRRPLALAFAALALSFAGSANAGTYTQTRYPIVLVHGLFGFDSVLGIDYWYGIPQALQADGARVFVAQVSAANSSEVRGEQLLAQVKNIMAITGATKVNLVGHSHGGPTIRYVAGVAPHLVASVTSVGGVNRGSKVADAMRGTLAPGSVGEGVVATVVTAFAKLIDLLSGGGQPQNSIAALDSLTTVGSAKFNQRFPAGVPGTACGDGSEVVSGVRYYSWTGNRHVTHLLDPIDPSMALTGLVFSEQNDGLVSVCSTKLGRSLGVYPQNHLDEVNQTVGLVDWFSPSPPSLYRQHANRLRGLGL